MEASAGGFGGGVAGPLGRKNGGERESVHAIARCAGGGEAAYAVAAGKKEISQFEGPNGKVSLADLFEGRPQLVLYRARFLSRECMAGRIMLRKGCSFGADQVAHLAHLNARNTHAGFRRLACASQADIQKLKTRMEWDMPWYTITDKLR